MAFKKMRTILQVAEDVFRLRSKVIMKVTFFLRKEKLSWFYFEYCRQANQLQPASFVRDCSATCVDVGCVLKIMTANFYKDELPNWNCSIFHLQLHLLRPIPEC